MKEFWIWMPRPVEDTFRRRKIPPLCKIASPGETPPKITSPHLYEQPFRVREIQIVDHPRHQE